MKNKNSANKAHMYTHYTVIIRTENILFSAKKIKKERNTKKNSQQNRENVVDSLQVPKSAQKAIQPTTTTL